MRQADIVPIQQQAKGSSSLEQIVTEYPGNKLFKTLHQDRMERHEWSKQMRGGQKIEEQEKEKQSQETYKFYSDQNNVRQTNIEGVSLAEYLAKKSS